MTKVDIQKLKSDAEKYRGKGKLDKAIELYEEIAKQKAGADAKTLQKMAEIYLKLEDQDKGIGAYRKAMKGYAETGFLVQAIAVGKILQELCPEDQEINKDVEAMLAQKISGTAAMAKIAPKKISAAEYLKSKTAAKPAGQEPEETPEETGEPEEKLESAAVEPGGDQDYGNIELHQQSEEQSLEEISEAPEAESTMDFLLFKNLSPEEFQGVYQKLRSVKIPAGLKICREGEIGDSIFIIAQGEAEVTKKNPKGEERLLARLLPGQFFGEFAYFQDGTRSATVEAVSDLELLEISHPDMDEIVKQYPQVKEVMLEFYKQRILDNLLALSPLTSILGSEDRKKLIDKFELKEIEADQTIIKEGDPGDAMFLIKSGKAEVTTIDPKDKRKLTLARLGPGEFFGEVGLIKNKPRTATITALTPVELLIITRQNFSQLSKQHPEMVSLLEQTIEKRVEDTINKIIGEQR